MICINFSCNNADIDECLESMNDCNTTTSYCVNSKGEYYCECLLGFNMTMNDTCECKYNNTARYLFEQNLQTTCLLAAINECKLSDLNDCHVNASCMDNFGSFDCLCNNGFEGNGTYCISQ